MLQFLLFLTNLVTVLGIFVLGFLSGCYYWYANTKINKQKRKIKLKENETSQTENSIG